MKTKPTHVFSDSKVELQALKRKLRLNSEAEVIAYMMLNYGETWDRITLSADCRYRNVIDRMKNQAVIE